jgi:hypothetical protein
MIITNNYKLPKPVYDRIVQDNSEPPKDGIYRVTSLIGAPYKRRLLIKHWHELVLDASEFIWTFFGHSLHYSLSERAVDNALTEERLTVDIDGVQVTGQTDLYRNGIISDYKTTSVWTIVYGRAEWEYQLNVYAWLLRTLGFEVNGLRIHAFLRDWSKRMQYDSEKPNVPYSMVDLPLWDFARQTEYVRSRIALHEAPEIPMCSAEDMWEKPTTYAVKGKGKKALKVDSTMESAQAWMEKNKKGDYIETREGCRTCCQDYCQVRSVCPQNIYRSENGLRNETARQSA